METSCLIADICIFEKKVIKILLQMKWKTEAEYRSDLCMIW